MEQTALPYYIPIADVLLLRQPANNAGLDVFRKRWDSMCFDAKIHLDIGAHLSLDVLFDSLERHSKCLRAVGRL